MHATSKAYDPADVKIALGMLAIKTRRRLQGPAWGLARHPAPRLIRAGGRVCVRGPVALVQAIEQAISARETYGHKLNAAYAAERAADTWLDEVYKKLRRGLERALSKSPRRTCKPHGEGVD